MKLKYQLWLLGYDNDQNATFFEAFLQEFDTLEVAKAYTHFHMNKDRAFSYVSKFDKATTIIEVAIEEVSFDDNGNEIETVDKHVVDVYYKD